MTVTTEFKIEYKKNIIEGYLELDSTKTNKYYEPLQSYYLNYNECYIGNNDYDEIDYELVYDCIEGNTNLKEKNEFLSKLKFMNRLNRILKQISFVDGYDILTEDYKINENDIKITITNIETDCGFDVHDCLCGSCDRCGECRLGHNQNIYGWWENEE